MRPENLYLEQFNLLEQISCPVALVDLKLDMHFANAAFRAKLGDSLAHGNLKAAIANEFAARRSIEAARSVSGVLPMRLEPLSQDEALLCLVSRVEYAGREMFIIQGSQTDANRFYKLKRDMEFTSNALSRERRIAQQHENTCRAIEAFVEVLVHDIRSPLATLVQGMDLLPLEMESENFELTRKMMSQLRCSSARLVDFVDSLYGHAQVHRARLNLESLDLGKLVHALVTDLGSLINEAGGAVDIRDPLPIIKADRQLLRQLLQNLVQNAVKFRSRERPLQIVIGCERRSDSHVDLYVQDNGVGFAQARSSELFEPYRRANNHHKEGLGIGLATCKSIAEKHGWSIAASSSPDQGARFTVRISSWM